MKKSLDELSEAADAAIAAFRDELAERLARLPEIVADNRALAALHRATSDDDGNGRARRAGPAKSAKKAPVLSAETIASRQEQGRYIAFSRGLKPKAKARLVAILAEVRGNRDKSRPGDRDRAVARFKREMATPKAATPTRARRAAPKKSAPRKRKEAKPPAMLTEAVGDEQ